MFDPSQIRLHTHVADIEVSGDIAGKIVVAEHGDAVIDRMPMAGRLALGQDRGAGRRGRDSSGRSNVGDAFNGAERLEAACARALEIGARSYSSVKSILKNDLDRQRPEPATDGPAIVHANIRGPTYFH